MNLGTLAIVPYLSAVKTQDGGVLVTRKFVDGMNSYADRWPGPVIAVMNQGEQATNNLDNMTVYPGTGRFEIEVVPFGTPELLDVLSHTTAVLSTPHPQLHGLSHQLRLRGIVSVLCTEYTLRTRLDIMRAETPGLIRAARRAAWEALEELYTIRDIIEAHGVQCNGTPTFDAYHGFNDAAHLYFDTRTSEDSFASEGHLRQRAERLRAGEPLKIAFSGRLLRMKGAHHLLPLARQLRDLGVDFEMVICGGGELSQEIAESIPKMGLPRYVEHKGVLDFNTQLLPLLRDEVDLFVAPHLQGDPSCTYLETMACGVPVVGYDNEAWAGILGRATVGWASPLGNTRKLARLIADLDKNRENVIEKSATALEFAHRHSFERTFDHRIAHIAGLVRQSSPLLVKALNRRTI